MELLKINPLVMALCNIIALNYNLNYQEEPAGEFGERFTAETIIPEYFHKDISLPLKTTWLQNNMDKVSNQEEWIRLGGLLPEKFQEKELRKQLRLVTGIPNLEVPLHAELSEIYRLEKNQGTFLQLGYALLQNETIIKDAWIKNQELEIKTKEKSKAYGTE